MVYDDIRVRVPEHARDIVRRAAEQKGQTVNEYINELISNDLGMSFQSWWYDEPEEREKKIGQYDVVKVIMLPGRLAVMEQQCRELNTQVNILINAAVAKMLKFDEDVWFGRTPKKQNDQAAGQDGQQGE